jgi:hypothetical protein
MLHYVQHDILKEGILYGYPPFGVTYKGEHKDEAGGRAQGSPLQWTGILLSIMQINGTCVGFQRHCRAGAVANITMSVTA